jgi:hypothetical protein
VRLLQQFQAMLAGIYDLPGGEDVAHYLLTDRAWLPEAQRASSAEEQLLVAEEPGGLALGLYLAPELLERLARRDPCKGLAGDNLADCWTALEGVSHFTYVAFNARHDRPVSLHELELQAEVDKYVCSLWLLAAQRPDSSTAALHELLFRRARIDEACAGERAAMYRRASDWAARYCARLAGQARTAARSLSPGALRELRRFYRLTNSGKQRWIARHA